MAGDPSPDDSDKTKSAVVPTTGGGQDKSSAAGVPEVEDLDLTSHDDPKTVTPPPPPEVGGSIGLHREQMRGRLAMSLVGILAIIIAGVLIAFSCGSSVDGLKTLLSIILGPVVALVGSVVGFYFGGLSQAKV